MIKIVNVDYNNEDFSMFCNLLEKEHIDKIKEQRCPYGNCLNGLEKFKTIFIAYADSKPAGCLAMTDMEGETIEIGRVYVLPEYRKQGVASSLFTKAEVYAKKCGAKKFILDTYERFESAVRLYKKLGFYEIENYIKDSPYSVCMEKNILNKNISVVIDGQAGSCGKGKICGYLSKKDNFSISTNNWSSNAGHTYVENNGRKIIVSHLPIALVNPNTKLCINAGAIITPEILYREIEEYKDLIGDRKIYIHPRAMIIQEKHREIEKASIRSGSTFKGCGAALADKVMRTKDIVLAKDYFKNNDRIEVTDTALILNEEKNNILVEGAQGQDLDINYGLDYPNVTSRMCSAAQLVADAGLSVFDVKDIYMIIRPYPIRISNETNIGKNIYSGDYAGSKEISWDEIAKRCGYDGNLEEYTTVTKKKRRVFEMNWDRLRYNVMINKPTQLVLNFAQYIDYKAYKCKNYDELPQKVKDFILKIEEETKVPVTIIGTGEKDEDIIDLRN